MSEKPPIKKAEETARWGVQIVGLFAFVGLVVLDSQIATWELDWIAKVVVGGFALGARPETLAEIVGAVLGLNKK